MRQGIPPWLYVLIFHCSSAVSQAAPLGLRKPQRSKRSRQRPP